MTINIVALAVNAIISIIIPVVIFIIIALKKSEERKQIILLFLTGIVIYITMEWGLKEHGLAWLFNHTAFAEFMNQHYIFYLLAVAAAGAGFALIPIIFLCIFFLKKKVSFTMVSALGLGYTMTESIVLIGYRSINTIAEYIRQSDVELNSTAAELFLSGYERILMSVIQIAILVVLVYFIEHNMIIQGGLIALFCHTLATFLPGFFIAFSLTDYYEVYDRSVALVLIYIILTAASISSIVILYSFHHVLYDKVTQR